MQPLDKTFFKRLKTAYNAAADTWMVAHRGKRISFYEIAEIFAVAYNRTTTVEKSVNGFRACGLWPFNDCIFSDEDYVEVATEEQECSRQAVSPQSDMSSHALLEDQRSPRSPENEQLVGNQEAQQSQRTEENHPLDGHHDVQQSYRSQENQEVNGRQEVLQSREITLQRDVPSTSSLSESARKAKRVLFQLPTPSQDTSSVKPHRGSKRVSEQSQHVTSRDVEAAIFQMLPLPHLSLPLPPLPLPLTKSEKTTVDNLFNFCGSVACLLLHFIILRRQKPSFIAITLPT